MSLHFRNATGAFRATIVLVCLFQQLHAQPLNFPRVRLPYKKWDLEEMCNSLHKNTGLRFIRRVEKDKQYSITAGSDGETLDTFLSRILPVLGLTWSRLDSEIFIVTDSTKILAPVVVRGKYNTGFQYEPVDTTTAAFSLADRSLLDLTVSSNLPDALENNVTGIQFNHGGQSGNGGALPTPPVVRGQSTISADQSVLYVVDHTLYDGSILNINPEDIQSMVLLKDAAATARYGVRAGNGVIVITTKRGNSSSPQLQYSSSLTWQGRPEFYTTHPITAADEIGYEQNAYAQGDYAGALGSSPPGPVPLAVYLMNAAATGQIPAADADARMASLAKVDSRKDISRYLYANSLTLREHLGISGMTGGHSYYYGFGYDHQPSTLADANSDRYTFRTENSFVMSSRWTINADAGFTLGVQTNGDNQGVNYRSLHGGRAFPAYQRLMGHNGLALPVFTDFNPDALRQLAKIGLDEYFRPVDDIPQEQNAVRTNDYFAHVGLDFRLGNGADLEAGYSGEYQSVQGKDVCNSSAYSTRDLQNTFAQVDSNGVLSYPVPAGGIATVTNSDLTSNQVRLQLNLHPAWDADHQLTALAGGELHSVVNTGYSFREYGYDEGDATVNSTLNFNTPYFSYLTDGSSDIPNPQSISRTTDHFLSGYMEAMYVDHKRFYATVSLREDAANLFGVNTNQKAIPLWSSGLGYELDSLRFYPWRKAIPLLKARASYGVSGNISRQASAYTTASYSGTGVTTSLANATILSPPNNNLRWERVAQFDGGLDFALKGDVLSGSVDYYIKSASDLMGQAQVDPTFGLISNAGSPAYFYGNVASMHGYGLDGRMTAAWINRKRFRWSTDFLVSEAITKVTKYLLTAGSGNAYLNPNAINPIVGRPLYAVYSYRWKGLDSLTGNPIGYNGGKASESWDSIWSGTTVGGMVYNGPSEPTWYGSVRNTANWSHWSLTVLLSFKLGYYFRRPSISYGSLESVWVGNSDYAGRWQQPGDEKRTNVPSASYNGDPLRDNIYTYSNILVDKGDHVRLEDIGISRALAFGSGKSGRGLRALSVFADAANLAILWRTNKDKVDPYYINSPRDNRRWSVGFRGTL